MINIEKEREAFLYELDGHGYGFEDMSFIKTRFNDDVLNMVWELWLAAKACETAKLEGCVVVPVRSDKEIINQTFELTDLLAASTNRFQRDPNCLFPFESNNPRVKEWWYVACQIQELLTNTDPTNCDFDKYKADVEAARGGNEKS